MLKDNLRSFGKQAASLAYPTNTPVNITTQNDVWWQTYTPPSDGIFVLVARGGLPIAEIQLTAYSFSTVGSESATAASWCVAKKGVPINYGCRFTVQGYARFYPARLTG